MLNFDEYLFEGKIEDVDISVGDVVTYITNYGSRRKGYVKKIKKDVYYLINTDGIVEDIVSKNILKILDKEDPKNNKFIEKAKLLAQEEDKVIDIKNGDLIEYKKNNWKTIVYIIEIDGELIGYEIDYGYNIIRIIKKNVIRILDKKNYERQIEKIESYIDKLKIIEKIKKGDVISIDLYSKKYIGEISRKQDARISLELDYDNDSYSKYRNNFGVNLLAYEINNVKILDKGESEKFRNSLKKYIESYPKEGDYVKINYLSGILKIIKVVDKKDNIQYTAISNKITSKNNKEIVFYSHQHKITKLNPDSKEVKDFEESLKNLKVPKKGDYLKFDYKNYKDLVAYVNNNLEIYYDNVTIKLKFAKPIDKLTKNTSTVRFERGLSIDLNKVKKFDILNPESEEVKKFQEEDAEFMKNIPSAGDYCIHKPTGKLCVIIGVKESGYLDVDFMELVPKKPSRITITEVEKTDSHPLIDFIKKGIYGKVKFSPKFNELIPKKMHDAFSDISYVDITDDIDTVSFIGLRKANEIETDAEKWKAKSRQTTRIGRIIQRFFPDLKQKEIEDVVNDYKANYKIYILGETPIEVVEGEDIRYWYDANHYEKGGGTLNNSCMRGKEAQPRMDLYVSNPDKIKLLIYKTPDKKKLLGRALLWFVDEPKGVVYMDRVYTRYDHDTKIFNMYADIRGYSKRTDTKMKRMLIKVREKAYYTLPYIDTFHNYNARKFTLSNY